MPLEFQPNQTLAQFPQQAIGLNQLGQQEGKRRALMSLNAIPGMVENGVYSDQGLMALGQIDPAMRDEAVAQREKTLESRSLQKRRQAEADKVLEQERTSEITDLMSDVLSHYYSTPGSMEARKAAMAGKLSEEVDNFVADGRAAKYGMSPQQIAALKNQTNPDDILVKLLKHGKADPRAEYFQAKAGAEAVNAPDAGPGASQPDMPAPEAGPQVKPLVEGQQPEAVALSADGAPLVDKPTFEKQEKEWDDYEKAVKQQFLAGAMPVDQFDAETAVIQAEKEKGAKIRAQWDAIEKNTLTGMDGKKVEVTGQAPEDLIAKAKEMERKAEKLRATGMPANVKAAKAWDQQAKVYRDKAAEQQKISQADTRLEQNDKRLEQADKRIQASIDRAKATQAPLPEEAVQFVADQIIRGNAQAGAGLARNQTAKAQIIAAYTKLAKERGMSPGDVNAAINEFQGLQQASRTLGTRSANIDVAAEELAQFIGPAEKASAAVPRVNFVPINRLIQLGQSQWSPEQAAFVAANRSVINAFAGLASRGVPTVHSTEEAEKMLSTAFTHDQYSATLRMLWQEAQAAIQATKNVRGHVRDAVTGKDGGKAAYPGAPAPAPAGAPQQRGQVAAPIYAVNPKTKERIQSLDGGKTWQPDK
jgi:hypothetical protein